MIRLGALAWLMVLALLGVGLFQVKYEVQARENELRQVRRQIETNEEAIRVLQAEWSYLNDLSRLNDLARRHTDLAPTTPSQIGNFADLPPRMPGPRVQPDNAPMLVGENDASPQVPKPSTSDDVIDAILADMRMVEGPDSSPLDVPATPTSRSGN